MGESLKVDEPGGQHNFIRAGPNIDGRGSGERPA